CPRSDFTDRDRVGLGSRCARPAVECLHTRGRKFPALGMRSALCSSSKPQRQCLDCGVNCCWRVRLSLFEFLAVFACSPGHRKSGSRSCMSDADTKFARTPHADVYRRGYLAGRCSCTSSDNPYESDRREARAWIRGLLNGRTKRLTLVT